MTAITTVLFLAHGSRCKSRVRVKFRDAADLLPWRVREKLQSASKGGMKKGPQLSESGGRWAGNSRSNNY